MNEIANEQKVLSSYKEWGVEFLFEAKAREEGNTRVERTSYLPGGRGL